MSDPRDWTQGLTPIGTKPDDVYLGSVETNIRRFGFALLRARAKTVGKAIRIAWAAMAHELCAITYSATIGCEKLPGERLGDEVMVPFIEILLLPVDSDEVEQPSSVPEGGTLLPVMEQGSTAEGVVAVIHAFCAGSAKRVVLKGSGDFGCSRAIRVATMGSERGYIEIDGQDDRRPEGPGGERVRTGTGRFSWDEEANAAVLEIGLTTIFKDNGEPSLDQPARPEPFTDVLPRDSVDLRPLIGLLSRGEQFFLRANAAALPRALATAMRLAEMNFAHFPDTALVRTEAVDGDRTEVVFYVRVQPKSMERQVRMEVRVGDPNTIQMGTQHPSEYILSLVHEALVTPGPLFVCSPARDPVAPLWLVAHAVDMGIIHPPRSARLGRTGQEGYLVQIEVTSKIVLQ